MLSSEVYPYINLVIAHVIYEYDYEFKHTSWNARVVLVNVVSPRIPAELLQDWVDFLGFYVSLENHLFYAYNDALFSFYTLYNQLHRAPRLKNIPNISPQIFIIHYSAFYHIIIYT